MPDCRIVDNSCPMTKTQKTAKSHYSRKTRRTFILRDSDPLKHNVASADRSRCSINQLEHRPRIQNVWEFYTSLALQGRFDHRSLHILT